MFAGGGGLKCSLRGQLLNSDKIRHARGDPHAPLTTGEMWTKFEDCCAWSGLPLDARALFDKLQQLDRLEAVSALFGGQRPTDKQQPVIENLRHPAHLE